MVLAKEPDQVQSNYYMASVRKSFRHYQGTLSHFQHAQYDPNYRTKAVVEHRGSLLPMGNMNVVAHKLYRAVNGATDPRALETLYGQYFLVTCLEKQRKMEGPVQQ